MNNGYKRPSTDNETNISVFGDDSAESQLETSVRIQRSYKDLIRKLEKKETLGFSQSDINSIGGSQANDSQYGVNENNIMKRLMDEAQDLYKNVNGAHEARLDARVLKQVSRICRLRSQELSVNQQKFQASEFADKLIREMGGSVKDENDEIVQFSLHAKSWRKLGDKVQSIVNTTPYFSYMLGSLSSDENLLQPKKKANPRVRNETSVPATIANVVDFNDKNSAGNTGENNTDVFVESTYKQLCLAYTSMDKEPICYFSFVLDLTSFGRTVENMFYTSFLIKEGKVKIFYKETNEAENQLPFIVPLKRRKHGEGSINSFDNKKQVLMTISIEDWIRFKNVFKRTEPMINHQRSYAEQI